MVNIQPRSKGISAPILAISCPPHILELWASDVWQYLEILLKWPEFNQGEHLLASEYKASAYTR